MVTPEPSNATPPPATATGGRGAEMAGTPGVIATLGAISGVLVFGALGALAGWGIVDTDCSGDCRDAAIWGGLIGAGAGAIGAAILAVLILRARFQWRVPHDGGDVHPSETLRNDSA